MIKKFLNNPSDVVPESLSGLVQTFSHLKILQTKNDQNVIHNTNIVIRADIDTIKSNQVTLVSGGGSGHEPAHALFVGKSMLSAAVCGQVFTSPDVQSILTAIRAVTTQDSKNESIGCLLIVKNYTGDKINFSLAMELARNEGRNVEMVVINDDCALFNRNERQEKTDFRRGIAGTCFVHKIVGAAAENGSSLRSCKHIAEWINSNMSTMGVSMGPCILPGNKSANFELPHDECELGLGIHGEAGTKRIKIGNVDDIITSIMEYISKDGFSECLKSEQNKDKRNVALMVNNLGGVSNLEMFVVARKAIQILENDWDVHVSRVFCGVYMSSLEMPGISITVVSLDGELDNEKKTKEINSSASVLKLLDHETECPFWAKCVTSVEVYNQRSSNEHMYHLVSETNAMDAYNASTKKETSTINNEDSQYLVDMIEKVCKRLISEEQLFTELDSKTGDGDLGQNIKRGSTLVLKAIEDSKNLPVHVILSKAGYAVQQMGGSSGPFFSIFFLRSATIFKNQIGNKNLRKTWTEAFEEGMNAICHLGGAKKGDRTMVDALFPVNETLQKYKAGASINNKTLFQEMYNSAKEGSEETKNMVAKKGRAVYLGESVKSCIDAGSAVIRVIFEEMSAQMEN